MGWLDTVGTAKAVLQIPKVEEPKSWFEVQDALFEDRLSKFINLGLAETTGKAIALRLYLRDFDKDERILCYECKYWKSYADTWKCTNAIKAGFSMREKSAGLGHMVDLLQRCNGFITR